MALKQGTRTLQLNTVLGEDQLLLTSFGGQEELSRLFRFQLEMISDNNAISPRDIVGTNVTVSVSLADESRRYFNGFVSSFVAGDEDEEGRRNYRAEVVPWLWFLTRTTDCRIFQDKTVPEIIEQVFQDLGFSDFSMQVKGAHPKHVYRVQYRETDFNFVSRLAEEEGIFYFFKHEEGKHTLMLADRAAAYGQCVEKTVDYPVVFPADRREGVITRWEHRYEFRTGKIAQTDYNFETPGTALMTKEPTVMKMPGTDKYEFYDYPGGYPASADGTALARLRMEEEEAGHDVVEGESTCRTFSPGHVFGVGTHKSDSEEGTSWVLTSTRHEATETVPYETVSGSPATGELEVYRNVFTCIPGSTVFRPERRTRRPFVQGPHTAVVVGAAGEQIYPDKFGRVKVQFFWDREGKKDEKSSCWVRVSQNWAGKTWGGMFVPHVGQEVIVDFLEGNPDRPIITGRVYNADQTVPLPLPSKKTQSIIRDHGGNQLIMEGKSGEQFISLEQQACGNTLQMNAAPGQESVKIQDKFGNLILLSSPDKTITLYSPNHSSGMVIGKSVHAFSESAHVTSSGGSGWEFFGGSKMSLNVGLKAEAFVGVQMSGAVGEKIGIYAGNNYDLAWGFKYVFSKEGVYNVANGDAVMDAKGAVIIDSGKEVVLLAGDNDHSRMHADDNRMILTYKRGGTPRPRAKVPLPALVGSAVAAGLQISHMADSQYMGWKETSTAVDDGSLNEAKKDWAVETAHESIGSSVASSVVSIGASFAAVKALQTTSEGRMQGISPHDAPQARVQLTEQAVLLTADDTNQSVLLSKENGIFLLSKDKDIGLTAKQDVKIEAQRFIKYNSPNHKFERGKIDHENFKVLD